MSTKAVFRAIGALVLTASPLIAQEGAEARPPSLLTPEGGLMVWTFAVFIGLFVVLKLFAWGPITDAVRSREEALARAIADAQKDREAAAVALAEHKAQLDASRSEAQQVIAEGRATAEAMKATMLEETHKQQQDLLDRARRDIASEKTAAVAELRREAVALAIAAAGKVIEKNLDDAQNKKLVEGYLATLQ